MISLRDTSQEDSGDHFKLFIFTDLHTVLEDDEKE